ncbi:MAG: hypothetical protein WKF58_15505 [Ilumatobacteraceae bacterium]
MVHTGAIDGVEAARRRELVALGEPGERRIERGVEVEHRLFGADLDLEAPMGGTDLFERARDQG